MNKAAKPGPNLLIRGRGLSPLGLKRLFERLLISAVTFPLLSKSTRSCAVTANYLNVMFVMWVFHVGLNNACCH